MKKTVTKFFAVLLVLAILLSSGATLTFAAETGLTASVESESGMPGESVKVNIMLSGNTGLTSLNLNVAYSELLTLTKVEFNSEFGSMVTAAEPYNNPQTLSFISPFSAVKANGVFATLTFLISDKAKDGDIADISLTYNPEDVIDGNDVNIPLNVKNGKIDVFEGLPGDINKDGKVTNADAIALFRYVAGWKIDVDAGALDCNGDGSVNNSDAIALFRYLAHWKDVKITRGKVCIHDLTKTEAKAATCTEDGNIAYWYCSLCEKYFSDKNATQKIAFENTVVEAKGHNVVIDPAVPADYEHTGLTEGSHCSVCNTVLVKQEEYGPLKPNTKSITYNIVNVAQHPYLATLDIDTSNLKTSYTPGQPFTLTNLDDLGKYGYTFDGWFDGFGNNATRIKEIPATANEDIVLYAHVHEEVYDITYNTYQTPVTSSPTTEQTHYTVSKGNYNLYNPEINNYKFIGWYDSNGVEYKNIPVGTVGNITLNAYYTSLRNLAVSVNDDNPIIIEDTDTGTIYYTYEIGEIRNVPIKQIGETIQSVAGLKQIKTETVNTTIEQGQADAVSNIISNMAVNSNTWTLSENWNDVTTVDESWAESVGKTSSEAKTEATTSSGTLSVTSQNGGSSYHKTEDGSTVYDYNTKTETKDKGHTFNASINGSIGNKVEANLGNATEYGTTKNTKTGLTSHNNKDTETSGISVNSGWEVNGGLEYGYHNNTNTVTKTGSDEVTVNSNVDENTSTWNNSSTFSSTNAHSSSETITNTLSDIITTTKEYGTSYSKGGTDTTTQGFSSSESNTTGSSSTLTWSKMESTANTTTYEVDGKIEGKYRQVLVGKAHIFGVVGYDFNTKSYFTYTFSVMDDETEIWLDYTPKYGDFHDQENSCVPFEIPIDIFEYVSAKTAKTKGVQYITDSVKGTARIVNYIGTEQDVIVPTYITDGKQFYKVTEIAPSAFAGKSVRSVILGDYITSIPNSAFKNCTELEGIIGKFTEIGDNAFEGCVNLSNMNLPSNVTRIGVDAFKGTNSITARAMNDVVATDLAKAVLPNGKPDEIVAEARRITADYIKSIIDSGTKNINLDISYIIDGTPLLLNVGEIDSFTVSGGTKTYSDFTLKSLAKETSLKEMSIINRIGMPLNIGSDTLTLYKIFVQSNNVALLMRKNGAILELNQDSAISTTGDDSIISKNLVIKSNVSGDGAIGFLTVNGNLCYVDSITGTDYIDISDGELIKISEELFSRYLQGAYTVTFDVNGGCADKTEKTIFFGNTFGDLPVATRDYYTFDGWFTELNGGEQVTSESVFNSADDITLYAHWTQNPLSDWVLASEVPSDATIEQTKWTYTLREYTTSSSSSKSGWTKYDTQRTSWGSTQGPVYSDPSNGSRNVWSEQYVASSNYKTVYVYYRWTQYGDDSGSTYAYDTGNIHYYRFDYPLDLLSNNWYGLTTYKYWYTSSNYRIVMFSGTEQQWVSDNYATRWYYQEPVYTYYFYKDTSKESTSDPTGQANVSNVVKYVQYRAK